MANVALSQFAGRLGLECRSEVCRPKVLILTSLSGTWGHLSQSIEVWQGLSVFSSLAKMIDLEDDAEVGLSLHL